MIGEGPIKFMGDILEVALNQVVNPFGGRQLVVIDKNREMYITHVHKPSIKKLGKSQVYSYDSLKKFQ